MNVTALVCSKCRRSYLPGRVYQLCECGKPLLVQYDLERAARTLTRSALAHRAPTLWRYREVLPVDDETAIVSLGEGFTPLLACPRLAARVGVRALFIKDESANPTGTFKARGMAVAVSMARQLGLKRLAVPSAGNAAGALAAYAARAGLDAYVFMPRDAPVANRREAEAYGACVVLVDGLITDCARRLAEEKAKHGYFDVSTLKEPYRVEGKKTMAYELVEQMEGEVPDVLLYPTGGGTGLIGMWKAFQEMEALGWIGAKRPRFFAVQASGCAPIVRAFLEGKSEAEEVHDAHTIASGLRVPRALGDFLILDILRRSGGGAIAVEDGEIREAMHELARVEGLFACPEGAACLPALKKLLAQGAIRPDERIVLFNTGSGLKYLDLWEAPTSS
ncbi:MAG: threonine synthase [Blastocatellia bacterium]|nr:threonine synthase [Blastocatellia bacterium]MCS7158248.1 threonine synthase [Blastocatellia bacterium]MCX7753086.1 threonine synthase [Blastocatellia bacterium]MDW8169402.1 threonine synthase [Acidobacteriota bacterium]MDW8256469.1 threonine synthase [Acidobacteriota bacterium]